MPSVPTVAEPVASDCNVNVPPLLYTILGLLESVLVALIMDVGPNVNVPVL